MVCVITWFYGTYHFLPRNQYMRFLRQSLAAISEFIVRRMSHNNFSDHIFTLPFDKGHEAYQMPGKFCIKAF